MELNLEQKRLIKNKNMGHYLIKGIAGSGKTTVGISRIPYLLNNYSDEKDKILFITYNKSLSKYIKHLYSKVNEENNISFFDDNKGQNTNVKVTTIDSIIYYYFKRHCEENKKTLFVEWNTNQATYKEGINKVKMLHKNATIINENNIKFLRDEIVWIKASNYCTLEEYQNADRIGRSGNGDGPTRLYKNSVNRQAIFELMIEIDNILLKSNKVDFYTEGLIALNYIKTIKTQDKYKHIIIDEAQDLTKVQLDFINTLREESDESSILFLTDVAQSIYPHAWLVKGRSFSSIGFDMKGRASILSKNYRTTTEIAEAAYSLLTKDQNITEDENFVKPSLLDKRGEYPVYRHFMNQTQEINYFVRMIKVLNKQYAFRDIAIVSRTNKNLELIKEGLLRSGIDASLFKSNDEIYFEDNKIKLLTMHSVKGLEFKIVILADLNSNIIPYPQKGLSSEELIEEESRERKLLYVGMTRATEKLILCSHGEASKFIKDINPNYLIMQIGSRINSFYNMPYDEYRFNELIDNRENEEESVRQWILNELITNYGYPKELIRVEYKVRSFSREGKVDVAIINGRTQGAHILVETKKRGTAIEEALNQLKSYMRVSGAKYGIATNGEDIIFIDEDGSFIKDIPVCQTDILDTSIENYKYIDKIGTLEKVFKRDINDLEQIIVEEEVITKDDLENIKIYSDIAAGVPIEIVDEVRGNFKLPIEWVKNKKDLFILTVKGDSMINANVHNKDLVVLQKTDIADNMEIVAVYYNGCTTLKRIVRMGDTVLLMSENPDYEPINITEGELRIMGKLIGVIRQV